MTTSSTTRSADCVARSSATLHIPNWHAASFVDGRLSSPSCCTMTNRPCSQPWSCRWAEGVPIKTHVLTLLHRLIDDKMIGGPPLDTSQALVLHREPKANVKRFDGLRAQIVGGRHAS
jgi:hypothetical protein